MGTLRAVTNLCCCPAYLRLAQLPQISSWNRARLCLDACALTSLCPGINTVALCNIGMQAAGML